MYAHPNVAVCGTAFATFDADEEEETKEKQARQMTSLFSHSWPSVSRPESRVTHALEEVLDSILSSARSRIHRMPSDPLIIR